MKKFIAFLLSALFLFGALSGCGKTAHNMGFDAVGNAAPESAIGKDVETILSDQVYDSADPSETPETGSATQRKLIRKISLEAETEDLNGLLGSLDSKIAQLGGYMENREIYSGSAYASYTPSRYAYLTIRIPKDRMDEFVAHVESAGNVTSSNETTEDVTLTYIATQSRMTALEKEEARLLELIDKAANLTELLELEKRLTQIRTELENVTSQLLQYDNLVAFDTISIRIHEVQTLTPAQEPGFWQRITTGFTESLKNLWNFLQELAIFLVAALPYLVPLGLVISLVIFLIRRSIHKRKMAKWPIPENKTE